jgi:DNA-directed RNA polymerase sigma subunit (sigma70/sigma32)
MKLYDHEEQKKEWRKRKVNMQRMRKQGHTYQSIADWYGISRQRVKQIIG